MGSIVDRDKKVEEYLDITDKRVKEEGKVKVETNANENVSWKSVDEFVEELKKNLKEAGEYGATEEVTEIVDAGEYPLKVNVFVEPVEKSKEGKEFVCDIRLSERLILENHALDWDCRVCVDKDTGRGKMKIKSYYGKYEQEEDKGKIRWDDKEELYEIARTLLAALLELGKVSENMKVKDIVGDKGVERDLDLLNFNEFKVKGYGYWKEVD